MLGTSGAAPVGAGGKTGGVGGAGSGGGAFIGGAGPGGMGGAQVGTGGTAASGGQGASGGASTTGQGGAGGTDVGQGAGGADVGQGGTDVGQGGQGAGGTDVGQGGQGTGGADVGQGGAGGTDVGQAGSGGTVGAGGGGCNPTLGQDICADGQKCSVLADTNGTQPWCNPPMKGAAFTVGEGQDCQRDSLGVDDCLPGLLCTLRGVLDSDSINMHKQCKKWCVSDGDCSSNQRCNAFTADASGNADGQFGVCVDACTALSDCAPLGGGPGLGPTYSCGDPGLDNDLMDSFFGCHSVGAGLPGDACVTSKDCGVDMFCGTDPANPGGGGGVCVEWCTSNGPIPHACSSPAQACVSQAMGIDICQ
jgi:hypothetical protein